MSNPDLPIPAVQLPDVDLRAIEFLYCDDDTRIGDDIRDLLGHIRWLGIHTPSREGEEVA